MTYSDLVNSLDLPAAITFGGIVTGWGVIIFSFYNSYRGYVKRQMAARG